VAIIASTQQVKKPGEATRRQSRRVSIESLEEEEEEAETTSHSSRTMFHGISLPFVCAIGFIQRLMMTSSEKMIPRAQLVASLVRLVAAVHDGDDHFERIRALFDATTTVSKYSTKKSSKAKKGKTDRACDDDDLATAEWDDEITDRDMIDELLTARPYGEDLLSQRERSTERLLSFVMKLSKSAKLNHRSLCLDMASSVLSADWLWQRHAVSSSAHTGVEDLIEILVTRCSDVTATVRCRALGALLDLFESIQAITGEHGGVDPSKRELIARVHTLVMGGPRDSGRLSRSLLETLRDLCLDEKPLVKVKAIHIFGECSRVLITSHHSSRNALYDRMACAIEGPNSFCQTVPHR
jgi:hypothetical protein